MLHAASALLASVRDAAVCAAVRAVRDTLTARVVAAEESRYAQTCALRIQLMKYLILTLYRQTPISVSLILTDAHTPPQRYSAGTAAACVDSVNVPLPRPRCLVRAPTRPSSCATSAACRRCGAADACAGASLWALRASV